MPRQARLRAAGIPWHVRQRANHGIDCFVEPGDRELYLGLLAESAAGTGCDVHAYVLMNNHIHLLLTPQEADGPSRLMKQIGERYVPQFNKRHRRYGTLWEGRYRSCPVETDSYLLTLYRYIEMNPVRAGMVGHPRDHPWSSYRCNAEGEPSLIVKPHTLYESLGNSDEKRRAIYRAAFADSIPEVELDRIRDAINTGFALGNRGFVSRLQSELQRKVARGVNGRPPRQTVDAMVELVW
jgi:putative transposase